MNGGYQFMTNPTGMQDLLGNRVIDKGPVGSTWEQSCRLWQGRGRINVTGSDIAGTRKPVVVETQTGTHQRITSVAKITCFGAYPFVVQIAVQDLNCSVGGEGYTRQR